ncbi:MAG: hypothetical protein NZM09_12135 [Ignavibacterium sp.]|nr:hypothetical protein [Ignavibacterium sp.]MDW8376424.1 hypothetical protein [Ignavibacteriales bacterium]
MTSLDNYTLKTRLPYEKGTVRLYKNGIRLKNPDDYTEDNDCMTLHLVVPFDTSDNWTIDYKKKIQDN